MECKIIDCKYYSEGDCELINPTLEVTRLMPITNAPLVVCANFEAHFKKNKPLPS